MQRDSDFFEGVRALLVDRDNAPNWMHSTYKMVPAPFIASFFQPLQDQAEWEPTQAFAKQSKL